MLESESSDSGAVIVGIVHVPVVSGARDRDVLVDGHTVTAGRIILGSAADSQDDLLALAAIFEGISEIAIELGKLSRERLEFLAQVTEEPLAILVVLLDVSGELGHINDNLPVVAKFTDQGVGETLQNRNNGDESENV